MILLAANLRFQSTVERRLLIVERIPRSFVVTDNNSPTKRKRFPLQRPFKLEDQRL